jgi:hypothetical protein
VHGAFVEALSMALSTSGIALIFSVTHWILGKLASAGLSSMDLPQDD